MRRGLAIAAAVALAALLGGTAAAQMGQGPPGPRGPGQMPEQMGKMMDMMTQMQEQMRQMQGQMQSMKDMGPIEGRMARMMEMMGQMRGMMAQHQEMMKQFCPRAGGSPTPKPGG